MSQQRGTCFLLMGSYMLPWSVSPDALRDTTDIVKRYRVFFCLLWRVRGDVGGGETTTTWGQQSQQAAQGPQAAQGILGGGAPTSRRCRGSGSRYPRPRTARSRMMQTL